ncbi:MAG: type II secretion system F family protein [Herbaspirillum sp.]
MSGRAEASGLAAAAFVVVFAVLLWQRLREPVVARRSIERPRRSRWSVAGLGAATSLTVVLTAGPAATVALAATVVLRRWWHVRRDRLRRARIVRDSYPDAIELVVLGIRAGLLPAAALATAEPHLPDELRVAFAGVAMRTSRGERFADALGALTDQLGDTASPMVDSLAAAERYGLPIAPVLERLADEARAERRRAADAAARQLPVRLAGPLVVCTLPSFVLLAIVPLLVGAFSSWHLP